MTERVASSAAVLVCQGRAVADGRYAVGRFSDPVARLLLADGSLRNGRVAVAVRRSA